MFALVISVTTLLNGQLVTDSYTTFHNSSETCEDIRQIAVEDLEKQIEKDLLGYSAVCKKA